MFLRAWAELGTIFSPLASRSPHSCSDSRATVAGCEYVCSPKMLKVVTEGSHLGLLRSSLDVTGGPGGVPKRNVLSTPQSLLFLGRNTRQACVLWLSRVQLFVTPWTAALQAPLSVGFSRQEYWSGLPCPSPGIFPTQGSNPHLCVSCIGRRVLYP